MLTLSRMKLAGIKSISGTVVPLVVIREIALSIGIDIPNDEKIDEERILRIASVIETTEPVSVSREFTGSTKWLENVASFVNRAEKFKKRELLIAFEHMIPFLVVKKDTLTPAPLMLPLPSAVRESSLTFGPKTRSSPLSYDACMLFRFCSDRGVLTTRSTTLEELSKMVILMKEGTPSLVGRIMMLASAQGQTPGSLINCLQMLSSSSSSSSSSHDVIVPPHRLHLRGGRRFLEDTDALLRRVAPQTEEEAIIIASRILGVNIRRSRNPLKEVLEITTYRYYHPWVPVDEEFRKIFLECPWMFSLTSVFQEDLQDLYSSDQESILQEHGFIRRGEDISGTILLVPGIHPSSPRETLITRTSVVEARETNHQCQSQHLLFSIRDDTGRWSVHSLNEITDFWSFNEGVCLIPGTMIHLPQRLITRLGGGDDEDLLQYHQSIPSRKLVEYHTLLRSIVKSDLEIILMKISDVAFFMRGWTGESMCPLPLSSLDTVSPPEASADIDERVQRSIVSVESRIMSSLPEKDWDIVLGLPLVWKYDDGICDLVIQGARTLGEKFKEVREAKDTTSCIRMSSNVLLFTVFFFRDIMRIPQEYQLDEIGIIS